MTGNTEINKPNQPNIQPDISNIPNKQAQEKDISRRREGAEAFVLYGIPALCFAALWIACLYRNEAGIMYPVFMAGTLWLLRRFSRSGRTRTFYELSMMLLSVQMCTTASPVLHDLDFLACFMLGISYVIWCFQGDTGRGFAAELGEMVKTCVYPLFGLPEPFMDAAYYIQEKSRKKEKSAAVQAVVKGVIIALPIAVIVIALLTSADRVFMKLVSDILNGLFIPEQSEYAIEITLQVFITFIGFYTICKTLAKNPPERVEERIPSGNPVTGITVLMILAAIYLVFCGIQVIYLFGHAALPEGYTYAEYAHEGFYQLVFVCLANLGIVTVCRKIFPQHPLLKALMMTICACTYVMIASCGMRMILYVRVYQLTFLRLFVLWFLVVLILLLTWQMLDAAGRQFPVFRVSAVTVTILYLAFAFAHPDYHIAKYNMSHEVLDNAQEITTDSSDNSSDIRYQDEDYLINRLSADAVPAIAADPELMAKWRLAHAVPRNKMKNPVQKVRTFNISEWLARKY